MNREPVRLPLMVSIWAMFEGWKLTLSFSAMNGQPERPYDLMQLEKLASLYGVLWDPYTLELIAPLIAGFLDTLPKKTAS